MGWKEKQDWWSYEPAPAKGQQVCGVAGSIAAEFGREALKVGNLTPDRREDAFSFAWIYRLVVHDIYYG